MSMCVRVYVHVSVQFLQSSKIVSPGAEDKGTYLLESPYVGPGSQTPVLCKSSKPMSHLSPKSILTNSYTESEFTMFI